MKMKTVGILLCLLCAGTAAGAQSSADEGLVHRRELVRRYMASTHMDSSMEGLVAKILPMMLGQLGKEYPNVPDKVVAAIRSSATEAMGDMLPKLEDRLADLMAKTFSTEELEQVTAFYESPTGQKIIAKSAEMASEVQPIVRDLMPGIQADMLHRLCAKIDCSTLPKPAKT